MAQMAAAAKTRKSRKRDRLLRLLRLFEAILFRGLERESEDIRGIRVIRG
jgi:hypothetical protein